MIEIEKYINDGEVQRSRIALDVADGSISISEIHELCSDQRVVDAFIGTSYNKKQPKETWNSLYLDQIICAAAAESFNQDYLLYLAEVGAYIRSGTSTSKKKMIVGVVAVIAFVVVIISIIIWKVHTPG